MAHTLIDSIRDGTFPDDDKILNQDVSADELTSFVNDLVKSKEQLETEISTSSRELGSDVDDWIARAKQIQEDIARCKLEAKQIVEQHEHGQVLMLAVHDTASKMRLLEGEIAFTKALEDETQTILEVEQFLSEVELDLRHDNLVSAVSKLVSLESTITSISAAQARSLLSTLDRDLRHNIQSRLEVVLTRRWTITTNPEHINMTIYSDDAQQKVPDAKDSFTSTSELLFAMQELQTLPQAKLIFQKVVENLLLSIIATSAPYTSKAEVGVDNIAITKTDAEPDAIKAISTLQTVIQFLHTNLPEQIRDDIARALLPRIISMLISQWLDLAMPQELSALHRIKPLREKVIDLATQIRECSWPGHLELTEWTDQIPRNWLARRRAFSLDQVRKAFGSVNGHLRPVERVEKQVIAVEQTVQPGELHNMDKDGNDDWNTSWDLDESQQKKALAKDESTDEDASGWDFDTEDEENEGSKQVAGANAEEDDSDAWGWGEDETAKEDPKEVKTLTKSPYKQANGTNVAAATPQEMILREVYHISDIPDHILEIIGKDLTDGRELQTLATDIFGTTSPATALLGPPNLVLAFFRATAPTYYSLHSSNLRLSNINLYNDTLYLIQTLSEGPEGSDFQSTIEPLNKFARQVYSAELDVQRTILTDLLDGSQGFERCTTYPNSQACIDAVTSTIDRVRQLHKEWAGIFGESHLLQSLGSLMTMIFGKVIKDVEEMDDISEAESKQLVEFCRQILSLDSLFKPLSSSSFPQLQPHSPTTDPTNQHDNNNNNNSSENTDHHSPSQIMLYVPNYLRFQYLQQILDSSLADIKYLWTEGELALEFRADEVEDLIKALFAESQHRRNALRVIRGSAVG